MHAASFGEMFLVLLTLGGMPMPVALPPGPEDPRMTALAPDQPLVYVSWAASAQPDKSSRNNTERLLAEPEIQEFCRAVEKAILQGIEREVGNDEGAKLLFKEVPGLVKLAVTRPATLYLSHLQLGATGVDVRAALVVNAGDAAEKTRASLLAMEKLLPKADESPAITEQKIGNATVRTLPQVRGEPAIAWGWIDQYIFIAVGKDEPGRIVQKLGAAPAAAPAWLDNLRKSLPVDRPCATIYATAKGMNAFAMLANKGRDARRYIASLAGNNFNAMGIVCGLDATGYVSRMQVQIDGEPAGLLAPFRGRPLTAQDLAGAPADSTFALVARVNLADVWQEMQGIVGGIDPKGLERFKRGVEQAEKDLGFKIAEDLLAPFGDSWCLYNSPGDGGLLFTGTTAVAKVKDARRLEQTHARLLEIFKKELNREERMPGLKQTKYRDRTIHYLSIPDDDMPFAIAWCLLDDEAVVSLYPQMVKSYLDRRYGESNVAAKSLSVQPAVKKLFENGRSPVFVAYTDTPEVMRLAYPLLHPIATMITGEMRRNSRGIDLELRPRDRGIDLDATILPRYSSVAPHLTADTLAVYRTEAGLQVDCRGTLPFSLPGAGLMLPVGAWLSFRSIAEPMEAVPPVIVEPAPVPDPAPPAPNE